MEKDLLSQADLLEYLQIGRTTLFNLLKKNELPHIRLGRKLLFRKKDIDKFLEAHLVK